MKTTLTCEDLAAVKTAAPSTELERLPFLMIAHAMETAHRPKLLQDTDIAMDGNISQGKVRVGDRVDLVGGKEPTRPVVIQRIFRMDAWGWHEEVELGCHDSRRVCVLLQGATVEEALNACAVAALETAITHKTFTCNLVHAGGSKALAAGTRGFVGIARRGLLSYVTAADFGTVTAPEGTVQLRPDASTSVQIHFDKHMCIGLGDKICFATQDSYFTGLVVSLAPDYADLAEVLSQCFQESLIDKDARDFDRRYRALQNAALSWFGMNEVPRPMG